MSRPPRPLTGVKDSRPCWFCSRQLRGFHGVVAYVDGNEVVAHRTCLRDAEVDEDYAGRLYVPACSEETP